MDRSAFTFSPFSNPWLLGGIAVSFLVRLLPTFVPAVGGLFRTASFPADWWWWILPCLLPGFLVLELDKLIQSFRSRGPGRPSPGRPGRSSLLTAARGRTAAERAD